VLDILPFLTWLAALTSAFVLAALWFSGEMRGRTLAVLLAWFALAAYCQFFAGSVVLGAVGLALQTVLAAGLIVRWKVSR
jgi:hypothetical protein